MGADGEVFRIDWSKGVDENSSWLTYVEGVAVQELRPA